MVRHRRVNGTSKKVLRRKCSPDWSRSFIQSQSFKVTFEFLIYVYVCTFTAWGTLTN